ncbi:hypothetical protein RIF29_00351 [Crotalaria pallida]|uniref:Uncharacterized protein n=1 Tax=Crotalaria pallida TaxID=3830 RepID=A0AAN9IVK8_CROPI
MPPEAPHQSPWSFYEDMDSNFDQFSEPYVFTMNDHVGDCELTSLFNTLEDTTYNSKICSIPFPSSTTMFTNDHILYPMTDEELENLQLPSLMEDFPMELDSFDPIPYSYVVGIQSHDGYQEESEGSFPSQNFSSEIEDAWSPTTSMKSELTSIQPTLTLPKEDTEIANQVSLPHLLEAFGEAMEQGEKSLAEVILRCISQKVGLLGESLERLSFYLTQEVTNHHGDYLKGEALKNFGSALRAFYQGMPNGKVAHFAAISSILEAIPQDCDVIHIFDFDIEEGLQWPPLFEAIANLNKTLILTSIKWNGDESSECVSSLRSFEETRRQLLEHARSCGLMLKKVEEKGVEEVVFEIKKMNKRGGRKEFLAFNCMVGLPHMGRVRSRREVMEFLRVAKDLIKSSGSKGIITFGDGDACEKLKNSLNFKSFFDGHLVHYLALLESIESHFTTQFSEARSVMELLFVAPYISSLAWLKNWEDMKSDSHLLQAEVGLALEGCRLSKNILMEISEVLRGNEGSYQTRIEGQNGNELVLEYKGTQLVRVSTWGN